MGGGFVGNGFVVVGFLFGEGARHVACCWLGVDHYVWSIEH